MNPGEVALLCLGCIALTAFAMALASIAKQADMQANHAIELRETRDWWSMECTRQAGQSFVAGERTTAESLRAQYGVEVEPDPFWTDEEDSGC